MRNCLRIIAVLGPVLASGCMETPTQPGPVQHYVGVWVYVGYEDDGTIMQRSSGLDSSNHGFIIHTDGRFLERKNAGWCGTPPIMYANYPGQWKQETDNILRIEVGYWAGSEEYELTIVSVTETTLVFTRQGSAL